MPRPSPPGCPGAVPVLAGPQAPHVRCPADAHSSGGVAVVSRSKCESQAAARCLSFRTRPSILRQAAAAAPSAPGRIQAWSIVRQEYPELVDRAARPRLTRRLGSRTKSALWRISRVGRRGMSLACCWHSVTWPGGLRWVSVELQGPGLAQLPGSSLAGRCPMTTAAPICCARHDPACLHRCRAGRPRRVPGGLPRTDPGGLRPGSAPVRQLVPDPLRGAVRGPPRRHRGLRQRT